MMIDSLFLPRPEDNRHVSVVSFVKQSLQKSLIRWGFLFLFSWSKTSIILFHHRSNGCRFRMFAINFLFETMFSPASLSVLFVM